MNSYFEIQDAFAREPGNESLSPEEKKLFKRIDEIMEKAGPGAEVVTREKVHISKLLPVKVKFILIPELLTCLKFCHSALRAG